MDISTSSSSASSSSSSLSSSSSPSLSLTPSLHPSIPPPSSSLFTAADHIGEALRLESHRDFRNGFYHWEEALRLGDPTGQAGYVLGVRLYVGCGIPFDTKRAYALFVEAANKGNKGAIARCHHYGLTPYENNPEKSFSIYKELSETGDVQALAGLGYCYFNGSGTKKDYKEAARIYGIAAEKGYPGAQRGIAIQYEMGHGVDKNPEQAFALYHAAAAQNDVSSQSTLALCYATGAHGGIDMKKSFMWFERSANGNDPDSLCNTAWFLERGEGITKNQRDSIYYYTLCEQCEEQNYGESTQIASLRLKDLQSWYSIENDHWLKLRFEGEDQGWEI